MKLVSYWKTLLTVRGLYILEFWSTTGISVMPRPPADLTSRYPPRRNWNRKYITLLLTVDTVTCMYLDGLLLNVKLHSILNNINRKEEENWKSRYSCWYCWVLYYSVLNKNAVQCSIVFSKQKCSTMQYRFQYSTKMQYNTVSVPVLYHMSRLDFPPSLWQASAVFTPVNDAYSADTLRFFWGLYVL